MSSSSSNNNKRSDASNSGSSNNDSTTRSAIDFLTMARGLKTTKRTGWVMREVPDPESVADHSWRIALMAMLMRGDVDTNKCIKMALVHDLAEATVGDVTPHCGISDLEKHEMESNAIQTMRDTLGDAWCGNEIQALWKEYEEGTTEEAKLVKDLDKLEMILQAQEYEADGNSGKSLDQFFTSTRGKWKTEMGQAWANEIESRRRTTNATKQEQGGDSTE